MSDRVQVWISRALCERAAQALEELANHRRTILQAVPPTAQEQGDTLFFAYDAIAKLENDASELRMYSEPYHDKKLTEDEQISQMQALLKELEKEGLRVDRYYSDIANLYSVYRQAMEQRKQAMDAWAALVDYQRVGLRALKLLAEGALQQDTHRRKDVRLHVLLDTLDNVLADLLGINVDEPIDLFGWNSERHGSWEMRRVLSHNHQLQNQIKALEATIANANGAGQSNGNPEIQEEGDDAAQE